MKLPEQIAVEAARQIKYALQQVNESAGKVMVLWPRSLTVLHDGEEFIFEFSELIKQHEIA